MVDDWHFRLLKDMYKTTNEIRDHGGGERAKHALQVTKTCHVSLTNIHSFVPQTKHFHWSSRHSCLANCLVWKLINIREKTFTLHGWTQMVVLFRVQFGINSELHLWIFQKAEICTRAFLKTHKCKLIPNWTRKTAWLLSNNINMKNSREVIVGRSFLKPFLLSRENFFQSFRTKFSSSLK